LERSLLAFTLFKLAGGAYLIYLGLRSLVTSIRRGDHASELAQTLTPVRLSAPSAFRQGILNNLLNPKAGAIFATTLPQFIRPGDSPLRLAAMLLAYEAILLIWLHLYGYAIARAGRTRFGARFRSLLDRLAGAALIALGVRLALERQ
jgi:threonine/homoserine/homoserine lactone efflux protein